MENATPIEAISLNFYDNSETVVGHIDDVIAKLKALESATGLKPAVAESINEIATAINSINVDSLNSIVTALSNLENIKIPSSIGTNLAKIAGAFNGGEGIVTNIAPVVQPVEQPELDLPYEITDIEEYGFAAKSVTADLNGISNALAEVSTATGMTMQEYLALNNMFEVSGGEVISLAEYFNSLTLSVYGIGTAFQALMGQMSSLGGGIATPLKEVTEAGEPSSTGGVVGYIEAISSASKMATENLYDVNAELDKMFGPASNYEGINPFKTMTEGATGTPFKPMKYIDIYDDMGKVKVMTSGVVSDMAKIRSEAVLTTTSVKTLGTTVKESFWGKGISDLATAFKKIGSATIGRGIGLIGSSMKSLWDRTLGAHSAAHKLFNSIKRIALYRAIRAAIKAISESIKTGVNNLYEWSRAFDSTREFANSMDKIATAALYVKNSLGAMVAPIINSLAPALDFLADKFVMLLNTINEFFAAITGASTYTIAHKVATEYKEAASDASGAAKALKSFTIGIDELNIIEDTGRGGGGAGSSGNVAEDWFEKVAVDTVVGNYFDFLINAIKNGDWETVGIALGDGFNRVVDLVPWDEIGTKAGKAFTGFFTTAVGFLDTADFAGAGENIATMINNFFEQADFTKVGETIVGGITGAIDFVGGIVGGIKWDKVAEDASGLISGAFQKGANWFKEDVNWTEVTTKFQNGIGDALAGVDWETLNNSMWDFLTGAGSAALEIMVTFVLNSSDSLSDWLWDVLHENKTHNELEYKVGFYGANVIEKVVGWIDKIGKWWPDFWAKWTSARDDTMLFITQLTSGFQVIADIIEAAYKNIKKGVKLLKDFFTGELGADWLEDKLGLPTADLLDRWSDFPTFAKDIMREVYNAFTGGADEVVKVTTTRLGEMSDHWYINGKNSVQKLSQGIKDKAPVVASAIKNVKNTAVSSLGDLYGTFKKSGEYIVSGLEAGIDAKKGGFYNKLKALAKDGFAAFNKAGQIHSPSKLFAQSGKWIVEGLNKGIIDNEDSTKQVVTNWLSSFAGVSDMIDTSKIATPNIAELAGEVSGAIATSSNVSLDKDEATMVGFMENVILPVITEIATDTKRQADKSEKTEFILDSRKVTQSVNRQNRNNGYSFT